MLIGASVFIIALVLVELLPRFLTGTFLSIIQAVVALAGIFLPIMAFAGVYAAFSEFRSNASFSISKAAIKFGEVIELHEKIGDDTPSETKFIDKEIELGRIRKIRVEQGWFARRLDYGNVAIFTEKEDKPEFVIPGVIKPHAFRDKFERIIELRNATLWEPKLPADTARNVGTVPSEPPATFSGAAEVRELRLSLWIAAPIALAVGHAAVFFVGLVIGIATNHILGMLIALALSSWPIGMFCSWGIYYHASHLGWFRRTLVALAVSITNGMFLAIVIYALVGRADMAFVVGLIGSVIVLLGSLFYRPDPPDPFFFELFEKPDRKQ